MEKLILVAIILLAFAAMCFIMPMWTHNEEKKPKDYYNLKPEDIDTIPDEELENAVVQWLFSKIDTKGTTEVPIMRAMPKACRYVYAVYTVSGEVFSSGFGVTIGSMDSFILSTAIEGLLDMGAGKLAGILEQACAVAGEHIRENGRDMSLLEQNEQLAHLSAEFEACNEAVELSDILVKYIKNNKDYFGD